MVSSPTDRILDYRHAWLLNNQIDKTERMNKHEIQSWIYWLWKYGKRHYRRIEGTRWNRCFGIIAADASEAAREKAKETLSICTTASNTEVSTQADVLFLSVKPQYYETVIAEIQPTLPAGQIIVTIAPGKTLAWLGERLGDVKIVRTMPNTPALVGEGITGVCKNNLVTEDEFAYVLKLLSSFGLAEAIPESLMDAVVSVSGSSPAYVFLFIEAMADAAVADGMPRAQAYKFAAQAVLGSAKMVLETGKHPAELKDMVCSPAGTTIEAVRVLEEKGFRGAVMDAMKACTAKAKGI